MRAAIEAIRTRDPKRVVVAVPTASPSTCAALEEEVDEIVCLVTPESFQAVGQWYQDFAQVSDDEVSELLEASRHPQ